MTDAELAVVVEAPAPERVVGLNPADRLSRLSASPRPLMVFQVAVPTCVGVTPLDQHQSVLLVWMPHPLTMPLMAFQVAVPICTGLALLRHASPRRAKNRLMFPCSPCAVPAP